MVSIPHERVTILAVADRAGVSTASVSRVLNGDERVGLEIRQKVHSVVRELNYRPNAAARSLRSQATGQLALVVDDIANPAYLEIVAALQGVAQEGSYRLLLQSSGGSEAEELAILESLGQRYTDGLIMTSTRFGPDVQDALSTAPVPVVVIGSCLDIPVDCITVDAPEGVRGVVHHLVDGGCGRLAMVNGPGGTLPARSRLNGFLAGAADVFTPISAVLDGRDWTREAGREAAMAMLERQDRPDGLVCANDQLALGVLDACHELDIGVPGDLAVAGVDNTRDASVCRPRLTSLDLSFAERGRIAGRLLLDRISGAVADGPQRIRVDTSLHVRESSHLGGA